MADLSGLGASSCGVWTRAEALTLLTPGQVDAFVEDKTWRVVWRGVYADAGHELDHRQRAWAAVLAAGGTTQDAGGRRMRAVACGRTAARVWGLPLVDDWDPATGHDEHRLDDVAVHRQLRTQTWAGRTLSPHRRALLPADVVRMPDGLWVTGPLRTLVDCAAILAPDALMCAVDAALHRRLVTPQALQSAAAAQRSRPHGAVLRTAVGLADGRAESAGETLARLLLLPELPGLVPQVELFDAAGRLLARFDLADGQSRFAVECDGKAGHAGAQMVAKDRQRDSRTAAHGWRTERVTWFELRCRGPALVARISGAFARHAGRAEQASLLDASG